MTNPNSGSSGTRGIARTSDAEEALAAVTTISATQTTARHWRRLITCPSLTLHYLRLVGQARAGHIYDETVRFPRCHGGGGRRRIGARRRDGRGARQPWRVRV